MSKKQETFVGTFSEAMAYVFQNNLNVKTKENKKLVEENRKLKLALSKMKGKK